MADADESLADILSSGGASSSSSPPRARFTSPEITQYLSHLTSLSLPEILHEPTTLASEAAQLTNSLTSLCHTEYPTFLSLHRTSSILSSTLSSFSSSLASLVNALPQLETQARQFSAETHTIQDARKKARLVLAQHDALTDALDLPQLIDTCVRSAYYQEAMDLAAHAAALAQKFPDIPLVQDVAAESAAALRRMLAQLLALLAQPAKLPALFKAVSFLRKAHALPEPELALIFLSSRLANLNAALSAVERPGAQPGADHARFVRRYVDVWREGVSDVVTQFMTIFLERAPADDVDLAGTLRHLLSTLTHQLLQTLLTVLAAHLPLIADTPALTSLLTQLTHCSASFTRLGLDFRAVLPPLFEDAVRRRFTDSLETATYEFCKTFSDAQRFNRQPAQILCMPAVVLAPPEDTALPEPLRSPPQVLASYPPLAVYTNAILVTLNNLRLLAPSNLLFDLLSALDQSLGKASSSFLAYSRSAADGPATKMRTFNGDEETPDHARIVKAAGKIFVKVLIPYSRRALVEGVYGWAEKSSTGKELQDSLIRWEDWLNPPDTFTS